MLHMERAACWQAPQHLRIWSSSCSSHSHYRQRSHVLSQQELQSGMPFPMAHLICICTNLLLCWQVLMLSLMLTNTFRPVKWLILMADKALHRSELQIFNSTRLPLLQLDLHQKPQVISILTHKKQCLIQTGDHGQMMQVPSNTLGDLLKTWPSQMGPLPECKHNVKSGSTTNSSGHAEVGTWCSSWRHNMPGLA